MTLSVQLALLALAILISVKRSEGHGYLFDPPGRSSMWRWGFDVEPNYTDNGLRCGGSRTQCGVCGDPASGPRDNEAGGKYAKGLIAKRYTEGDTVKVTVIVTANHKGWFEFHLCPNNNIYKAVTEECLASNVLRLANGETRYYLQRPIAGTSKHQGAINIHVQLPEGVVCSQCVLRWKWITEITNNEQFYGCSDISIAPRNGLPLTPGTPAPETHKTTTLVPYTTHRPTTHRPETHRPTTQRPFTHRPITNRPATKEPLSPGYVPVNPPTTHSPSFPHTWRPITHRPTTNRPSTRNPFLWPGQQQNTWSPTKTPRPMVHGHHLQFSCAAVGVWQGDREMVEWCNNNCNNYSAPYCPKHLCTCVARN